MKQIDAFTYEVTQGETVTIAWTAVKVADSCIAMAVDLKALEPVPKHPPTFTFEVTREIGFEHFAAAEGSFPAGTADGARFSSVVAGSPPPRPAAGGGTAAGFTGPIIRKSDPPSLRMIILRFRVVA